MLTPKSDTRGGLALLTGTLLVGFSSAYLTSITSLSPYYGAYSVAVLLGLAVFCYDLSFRLHHFHIEVTGLFFVYVLSNLATALLCSAFGKDLLNSLVFNHLLLTLSLIALRSLRVSDLQRIGFFYLLITVAFVLADTVYRFSHPASVHTGDLAFYNYKFGSLLFTDSNWTGFICAISIGYILYVRSAGHHSSTLWLLVYFGLTILTLSRSAIATSVIMIFLYWFPRQSLRIRVVVFLLALLSVTVFLISPFTFMISDESLDTKFVLLEGLNFYFTNTDWLHLFLGNGVGASSTNYGLLGDVGVSAHLYVVMKLIDIGLLGLGLELLFFFILFKIAGKKIFYILLPFFICGLSMCPSNLSFFYGLLALVTCLEFRSRKSC